MKCPEGYLIGYDYNLYEECSCSKCGDESYRYCRRYRKTCIGKADFGSKVIANIEARKMGSEYQSYKCDFCGGWHIGRSWNY